MKKKITYQIGKDPSFKVFVLVLVGGIFVLLGGLAVAGHLMNRKDEERETEASLSHAGGGGVVSAGRFKCISHSYPLQSGTCHPDVKILQQYLKKAGAALGNTGKNRDGIDGRFGPETRAAAKRYLNKEVFNVQDIQKINKA